MLAGMVASGMGQAAPGAGAGAASGAAGAPAKTAPLRLQTLAPETMADPFPATNPKLFTTDTPSVATVDSYLHAVVGYDAKRIWRVVAIQKTAAAGVSKVVALISEKSPNAKVQQASFFILPDGKHLIADTNSVLPFGADPYADYRAKLQAGATGPATGASGKELLLVEFTDLQCPHCKDAQATMKRLTADFPQAKIVYESLPLVEIHPYAEKAALYAACMAKKSTEAFLSYEQAVYDLQSRLTATEADGALNAAVTKAGGDPSAVRSCAAGDEAKKEVDASVRLAADLGINETPMLAVNGRLVPLGAVPYETLREIVLFQAGLDGVRLPLVGLTSK